MIETMKHSPRAYAFFDIARLVLNKPDRHRVKISHAPAADGTRAPLFFVTTSENPFRTFDDALRHVFARQADKIYRVNKKPVEPPKGNFQFVCKCGMTGELLGPPNYHQYQERLIRHHQHRLRHVPFDVFKSRIQTIRDPEVIQAWIAQMSSVNEYECLLDSEPKTFPDLAALQHHFVEAHKDAMIQQMDEIVLTGHASRAVADDRIHETIRFHWQSERRFPLKTANELRPQLQKAELHFFKHNKSGITYVSSIRPRRFDHGQVLTDHVRNIVTFLREHEGCTRKDLLEHLVKTSPAPKTLPATDSAAPTPPPTVEPSNKEELLLSDLHWLVQDGYVVEFADGRLWALPDRPPKPAEPVTPPREPTVETPPSPAPAAESVESQPVSSE
jgi:hypothetical protein